MTSKAVLRMRRSIKGWDRRNCERCGRIRTHYRIGTDGPWKCIGNMPGHIGARCGSNPR